MTRIASIATYPILVPRPAPVWTTAFAVAQNVIGVVMTSSPGPTPDTSMARCKAAVQELTATASADPMYFLKHPQSAFHAHIIDARTQEKYCGKLAIAKY